MMIGIGCAHFNSKLQIHAAVCLVQIYGRPYGSLMSARVISFTCGRHGELIDTIEG